MTPAAFHNAETVDMALGCSTNTMLHLPAIAHEAGVELDLDMANDISAQTPNLCHLAPAGDTYMEDLDRAGGVLRRHEGADQEGPAGHHACMTCTGKTVAENLEGVDNRDPEHHPPHREPLLPDRRHRRAARATWPPTAAWSSSPPWPRR